MISFGKPGVLFRPRLEVMARTAHGDPVVEPFGDETYRNISVDEAILEWNFESVWGLLVDGQPTHPLPPAEEFPLPFRTGDHRVDMQVALAGLAPVWGFRALSSTDLGQTRHALARASVMALSFLAQSARGIDVPAVPEWEVRAAQGIVNRFLTRWQGRADERCARAINAAWIAIAAEPACPSLQVARDGASTGADVAACLSMAVAATSGPFVSGGSIRLAQILADADPSAALENLVGEWGLARRPTPVASSRVAALQQVSKEIGADTDTVRHLGEELARLAHPAAPTEQLLTTLWVTHLFMFAGASPRMLPAMFACGKTAGWAAVIMVEHIRLLEIIHS